MRSYVLDTHACLFALARPSKLGRLAARALQEVEAAGGRVWVPAAVVAEVVLLKELGRSDLGLPALKAAFEASTTWRFLPLDLAQLDAFAGLTAIRDPFDRMIVSAARAADATLITRDEALDELGLVSVVWS